MSSLTPPVTPIILGGDSGAYSLARAFHEAYGVRSIVISTNPTYNVGWSRIVENVYVPDLMADEHALVRAVREAAAGAAARPMVVSCIDWYVRALAANRQQIEDVAVVPYVDVDTIDRADDKRAFARLCAELGVTHPATVVVRAGTRVAGVDLEYPLVAKAANARLWNASPWPGRQKVHYVRSAAELQQLCDDAGAAGYNDELVVQEIVDGDDSQMRIVTTFSNEDGKVVMVRSGSVFLEEHTPGTLGNPAAIRTESLPEIEAEARRIVEHLGWRGFANFDVKVDPRTGKGYIFELNPRTGRSNYYLTATGANPAKLWVDEHLGDGATTPRSTAPVLYRIVPRRLLKRYVDAPTWRALQGLRSVHPMRYRRDARPRRFAWVLYNEYGQYRKFARYYPRPRGPLG